jgi:hypothetical protein
MKKLLWMSFAAISFAACNDSGTDSTTVTTSDTSVTTATGDTAVTTTPVDTTTTTMPTATVSYTPAEGDVRYMNGHLMVYRGSEWVVAKDDVTLDNGVVVTTKGHVKKTGAEVELSDGETVSRSGNFFDKTGEVISDGWDATKHGVAKAGQAVAKGAKAAGKAVGKAADAVKDAVVGDKDEKK